MADLWLQNLAFYSLQIAVVAAAGALLLRLLQIRIPRRPLDLLAGADCRVSRCFPPSSRGSPRKSIPTFRSPSDRLWRRTQSRIARHRDSRRWNRSSPDRRRRRDPIRDPRLWASGGCADIAAIPHSCPARSHDLQRRLGVFADVQVSTEVAGPVTFGFLRPVILLPEACLRRRIHRLSRAGARAPARLAVHGGRRMHLVGLLVSSRHVVDDGGDPTGARRSGGSRSGCAS